MSYDLMVFDPATAPNGRAAFLDWYDERSEWEAPHGYDSPALTTPALRAWFMDMIATFPPLNGPYASDDPDGEDAADYTIDAALIYVAFGASLAERADAMMRELAGRHGIGFFDANGATGAVWLPDGKGGLALAHEEED